MGLLTIGTRFDTRCTLGSVAFNKSGMSPLETDIAANYRMLVESFCEIIAPHGFVIKPYHAGSPLYFSQLTVEQQSGCLQNFSRYAGLVEAIISEGKEIGDDRYFLWRMIQKLGLRPTSDLFSRIGSEDFVEIYTPSFIQVFRNLRFFNVCSYSLDELLARPFFQLFRRDEHITNSIIEDAISVFQGTHAGTKKFSTGIHTLDEIDSPRLNRSILENKFFSPLYDGEGRVCAAVNVIRGISCRSMVGIDQVKGETNRSKKEERPEV